MARRRFGLATITVVGASVALAAYCVIKQPMPWVGPKTAGDRVDFDSLRSTVQTLSETFRGRSLERNDLLTGAGAYIEGRFRDVGLQPTRQSYRVAGKDVFNILARVGPTSGKRLIVGAHYDVDGPFPGADDNASGVAVLLELARLLKQSPPKHPVEFVAYTLEEQPSFPGPDMGSAVHAKSLHDMKAEVAGMISLEMLGYFSDEERSQRYPLLFLSLVYPTKGNFIALVGRIGDTALLRMFKRGMLEVGGGVPLRSLTSPIPIAELGFSDHKNYWESGYSAVMVTDTAFFRNPHYHTGGDTSATLDFERMAGVAAMLAHAVREWKPF